jgi:hypothetical protein
METGWLTGVMVGERSERALVKACSMSLLNWTERLSRGPAGIV